MTINKKEDLKIRLDSLSFDAALAGKVNYSHFKQLVKMIKEVIEEV